MSHKINRISTKQGKRAVGEIFSWVGATVLIFFIVFLSIILYFAFGNKIGPKISESQETHFLDGLENQRATSYFLNYGLDGNEKGQVLYAAYNEDDVAIKKLFDEYERERGTSGKGALLYSSKERKNYLDCARLNLDKDEFVPLYLIDVALGLKGVKSAVSFLPAKSSDLGTYPLWVIAVGGCNEK